VFDAAECLHSWSTYGKATLVLFESHFHAPQNELAAELLGIAKINRQFYGMGSIDISAVQRSRQITSSLSQSTGRISHWPCLQMLTSCYTLRPVTSPLPSKILTCRGNLAFVLIITLPQFNRLFSNLDLARDPTDFQGSVRSTHTVFEHIFCIHDEAFILDLPSMLVQNMTLHALQGMKKCPWLAFCVSLTDATVKIHPISLGCSMLDYYGAQVPNMCEESWVVSNEYSVSVDAVSIALLSGRVISAAFERGRRVRCIMLEVGVVIDLVGWSLSFPLP
jgi:hypothetical protein